MKKVAISACLMGFRCRYDATDNLNRDLLEQLKGFKLVPFCPEDYAFGSPRPTMDLIKSKKSLDAISNVTGESLSQPIIEYAQAFFDAHPDLELFIGKDRSPSCGVNSAKIYNSNKKLLSTKGTGLMAQEAKRRGIKSFDSETYSSFQDKKYLK